MTIKVSCDVDMHETQGQRPVILQVQSHWCNRDLVVLRDTFGDEMDIGKKIIVNGNDLIRAVKNAMNV